MIFVNVSITAIVVNIVVDNRIVEILSGALEFVEDDRIKVVMADAIRNYVGKVDLSKSAGNILGTLTAENRHQALLDESIGLMASWMNEKQTQEKIADYLAKWVEDEYPTISRVLPRTNPFVMQSTITLKLVPEKWHPT